MAEKQQPHTTINNTRAPIPTAQLWTGPKDALVQQVYGYLQQHLCPHGGCATCATCTNITKQQHYSIMWVQPEKQYTLDILEPVFAKLSFAQQENEIHFFILHHADFLTAACANKLLKPLEEPPPGYHFILLAEQPQALLSTIRSRCMLHTLANAPTLQEHPFFALFSTAEPHDPATFLKKVTTSAPNDRESITLVSALLREWITKSHNHLEHNELDKYKQCQPVIDHLKQALRTPPMPGSSKIFWKDLFLRIKTPA